MDFTEIRSRIVIAIFSDDFLTEHLVLKGGNALELAHGVIQRGSLDIDLAMQEDFSDLGDIEQRFFRVLSEQFEKIGYIVFDFQFSARPRKLGPHKPSTWGGYLVEFKLISQKRATELLSDTNKMSREAHTIGPGQQRKFRIEISKYEHCSDKTTVELNGHPIFVYTPEMCVLEKLRALCQQLPDYAPTQGTERPRARDFFDIYSTVERLNLDLATPQNLVLCRNIFSAKDVPLSFIPKIESTREFHRPDWDRVRLVVPKKVQDFDFYFDYVISLILPKLQSLWEE